MLRLQGTSTSVCENSAPCPTQQTPILLKRQTKFSENVESKSLGLKKRRLLLFIEQNRTAIENLSKGIGNLQLAFEEHQFLQPRNEIWNLLPPSATSGWEGDLVGCRQMKMHSSMYEYHAVFSWESKDNKNKLATTDSFHCTEMKVTYLDNFETTLVKARFSAFNFSLSALTLSNCCKEMVTFGWSVKCSKKHVSTVIFCTKVPASDTKRRQHFT